MSCASKPDAQAVATDQTAQWAANGWLSSDSDPEIVGLYLSREACDAAVARWMSRQAAGDPVRGECLPIDRR